MRITSEHLDQPANSADLNDFLIKYLLKKKGDTAVPHRKLQPLLDAIEREKSAPTERHKMFMSLLADMYAFEHGYGNAPSIDNFLLWIASVEKRPRQNS